MKKNRAPGKALPEPAAKRLKCTRKRSGFESKFAASVPGEMIKASGRAVKEGCCSLRTPGRKLSF